MIFSPVSELTRIVVDSQTPVHCSNKGENASTVGHLIEDGLRGQTMIDARVSHKCILRLFNILDGQEEGTDSTREEW
jgi:hypothetical protein